MRGGRKLSLPICRLCHGLDFLEARYMRLSEAWTSSKPFSLSFAAGKPFNPNPGERDFLWGNNFLAAGHVGKQLVFTTETSCFRCQYKLFSMAIQVVSGSPCQAIFPFVSPCLPCQLTGSRQRRVLLAAFSVFLCIFSCHYFTMSYKNIIFAHEY